MSKPSGSLQDALAGIAGAIAPLERDFAPEHAVDTFTQVGLGLTAAQADSLAQPLATAIGAVHDMVQAAAAMDAAIEAGDDAGIVTASVALASQLARAIQSIDGVKAALHGLGLAIAAADIDDVPSRVLNLLMVDALAQVRSADEMLAFLGVLQRTAQNVGSVDPANPPFSLVGFRPQRVADWLQSPAKALHDLYQWNDPAFDGTGLLQSLGNVLTALGFPAFYDASAALPELDLVLFRIVPKLDVAPKGLAITALSDVAAATTTFGSNDWKVSIQSDFALPAQTAIVVQPTGVSIVGAGGGSFGGQIALKAIADSSTLPQPYLLIGQPGGSGLSIARLELDVGAQFHAGGGGAQGDVSIGGAVSGGKLHVSFSEADGFIGQLMSGVKLDSTFDFGFAWSTAHGLYFIGASSLEIQLPTHLDLGPVTISAITLSVGIDGASFPTSIAADIGASLGPLQAIVQQIGVEVDFSLKDDRTGNAGPLDVHVGFKPPHGAGLSIDTGIVVGGGFLLFDPDKGEYDGVAELSIADIVTVKAIALITTRMPDGSDGFSLLLIITTDFPPIQLGFGFTLNAVGGLLGLNRAVLLDVLRDGVRTGVVDSIMFPDDVIANAPRIISDLKSVFPPQPGVFLIGPMARLGWGTPSLITLSLGVVVEIPPGNIAILGVLKIALPDEKLALILVQVNFIGILDFDEQLLSFDASLYESHVLFMTLQGDMAVRLGWGDDPAFVISIGGFHPAFRPPSNLHLPATMKRLQISILDYDWAKISVDCYFAVTSNTVQFGAHLHLFFGVDQANLSGELGLDVLFQFSPFRFVALITGSLAISVFGTDLLSISLRLQLEGTSPWRAAGSGSISILFFSVDVSFDVTWGEKKDTSLPPVDVLPILLAELAKQANWSARPPSSRKLLVTQRTLAPSLLVLHPFGTLVVAQRAMPLGLTLDKLGSQKPDDVRSVDITGASSGGVALPVKDATEHFAIAQFEDLDDADKLSRPSYQSLKGGVKVGTDEAAQTSRMTRRRIAYDVLIEDKAHQPPPPVRRPAIGGLFHAFLAGGAVGRSPLSVQQRVQLQPFADTISLAADAHTVANTLDNTAFDQTSTFASEAMARQYMRELQSARPELAGTLHVLPDCEVTA